MKDILDYTLFELIEYYCVGVQNSRNNHKIKLLLVDNWQILDTLKTKWMSDLLDLRFLLI